MSMQNIIYIEVKCCNYLFIFLKVNDNNKNVILPSTNTIKTFSHSNSLSRQSNGTLNQKKKKKLLFCCIPIN